MTSDNLLSLSTDFTAEQFTAGASGPKILPNTVKMIRGTVVGSNEPVIGIYKYTVLLQGDGVAIGGVDAIGGGRIPQGTHVSLLQTYDGALLVLGASLNSNPVIEQLLFVDSGSLALGRLPGCPVRPGPTELYEIDARLGTAGTTSTTVLLEKNLSTIATITFPANVLTPTANPVVAVVLCNSGDMLTPHITTVGNGALNLSLAARMRYP